MVQQPAGAGSLVDVFGYVEEQRQRSIDRLMEYVRMPSISAHGTGIGETAQHIAGVLSGNGRSTSTPAAISRRPDHRRCLDRNVLTKRVRALPGIRTSPGATHDQPHHRHHKGDAPMTAWTSDELAKIGTADELELVSRRRSNSCPSQQVLRSAVERRHRAEAHAGNWE
jgi:hypothetical protein